MRQLLVVVLSVILLLGAGALQAQPALTEAQVRGFIASLPDVTPLGGRYLRLDPAAAVLNLRQVPRPMARAVDRMIGHDVYADMRDVVGFHGFTSPEAWAQVGDRVLHAFVALQLEGEEARLRREMRAALRQIDANPELSPDQRRVMKEIMADALGGMQIVMQATPADMAAVRPHQQRLRRAMDP